MKPKKLLKRIRRRGRKTDSKRPPRIWLLDPSAADQGSHHFFAAQALVAEARSLGIEISVLANENANRAVRNLPAEPYFPVSGYAADETPSEERRRTAVANAKMLLALKKLEHRDVGRDDFVFFPAITSRIVLAVCQWIASFDPSRAPRFGLCLMFAPDWSASGRTSAIAEHFYRSAFSFIPENLRRRVAYTCETQALSDVFAPMVGMLPIVQPIPTLDLEPQERVIGDPPRVAFFGYTKHEKGAQSLPEVLADAEQRFPPLDFTIQLMGNEQDLMEKIERDLEPLEQAPTLIKGAIGPEEMGRHIQQTDLLLLPYDPTTYATRGSALFTEARTAGVPMLVPAGTAFGEEAVRKGIGVAIRSFDAKATVDALGEALPRLPELRDAAAREARRIQDETPGYLAPMLDWHRFGPTHESALTAAPSEAVESASKTSRPTLHLLHHLARTGGTFITRCLASMEGVSLLSEVNPLGVHVDQCFDPIWQAEFWLKLLTPREAQRLREESGQAFAETLREIARRANARGEALIIRDWSYLDFSAQPLDFVDHLSLPPGSYSLSLAKALENEFTLTQAATVRHPAATWRSWRRYAPESRESLEDFLRGTRHFAEQAVQLGFVRYEDFTRDPTRSMRSICTLLDVPFDAEFRRNWPHYRHVTGDTGNLDGDQIRPTETRPIERELLGRLEKNDDYLKTVELLGYEVTKIP